MLVTLDKRRGRENYSSFVNPPKITKSKMDLSSLQGFLSSSKSSVDRAARVSELICTYQRLDNPVKFANLFANVTQVTNLSQIYADLHILLRVYHNSPKFDKHDLDKFPIFFV